jgi:DNA polymerase III epsilon subunit-like protein
MISFIFDTETSGLPKFEGKGRKFPDYKNLEGYDSARLLSISWILTHGDNVIEQSYYVVKPDGFVISKESEEIHGISQEYANANGLPIRRVLDELSNALQRTRNLVAHNIEFDINIIKSEFYRYDYVDEVKDLEEKHLICTMKKGKEYMQSPKNPKLSALYKHLYNEELTDAHNAQADTLHCYKCFVKMFPADKTLFYFKNVEIKLTDEQKQVVFAPQDCNMLVIASAGSGKTSTTICRIKHLIDSGVPESSIILTTFTRDSCNDMRNKLFDIMGYKADITIGTIDSISKYFTESRENKTQMKHVSEYSYNFLKMLRSNKGFFQKYKYLFIDEIQDINDVQFDIINEFYKNGINIFGVGDDSQNIYSFRGSNIEYILNFSKHFQNTHTFKLTYNFRSSHPIVEFANSCMENNIHQIPKKMVSGNKAYAEITKKPNIQYFSNNQYQNATILKKVQEYIASGVPEHEIAILSPVNSNLYLVEEVLTKSGISNIYLDGKADVRTMKKHGHICLATIHKSKGLEWDKVFLINMSDESIPRIKSPKNIDEDRRLFYVGITRPKTDLNIYYVGTHLAPFVTRYVGEIDKSKYTWENFQAEYLVGKSENDYTYVEKSVTKLVEMLDGSDYIKLKENGVLPSFDIKCQKLFEASDYNDLIKREELYTDFGTFVDNFITREVAIQNNVTEAVRDKYALETLANVTLDSREYEVYRHYKFNFLNNLKDITHFEVERKLYLSKLERGCKSINRIHLDFVQNIMNKIKMNSQKYKIPMHKIPVFNMRFLPEDFESKMKDHLDKTAEVNLPSFQCLNDVWEVSKCRRIVIEYRRRLLFKSIDGSQFAEYKPMFDNITNIFGKWLADAKKDVMTCHEEVSIKEGVCGELDLRVDDMIIDYKCTINDNINIEWIVQLLCYKALCNMNKIKINKIGIFNPLKGCIWTIDVGDWNKQIQLIEYLTKKRDVKLVGNQNALSTHA